MTPDLPLTTLALMKAEAEEAGVVPWAALQEEVVGAVMVGTHVALVAEWMGREGGAAWGVGLDVFKRETHALSRHSSVQRATSRPLPVCMPLSARLCWQAHLFVAKMQGGVGFGRSGTARLPDGRPRGNGEGCNSFQWPPGGHVDVALARLERTGLNSVPFSKEYKGR